MYYKRKDDIKWKGPGKVIGQDGPVVFIRHRGFYIKVHCCRVEIADSQQNEFSQNVPSDDIYKEVSKETEIDMTNNTKTMSQEIFIDSDTEVEQLPDTEIIDRKGKAKGQYKNCFNVGYKKPSAYESTQGHVNFDKVNDIKVIDKTEQVLIVDDECFDSAKEKELSSWKQNNVYVEVPYNGQNLISLKWVCTLKTVEDCIILFQKHD